MERRDEPATSPEQVASPEGAASLKAQTSSRGFGVIELTLPSLGSSLDQLLARLKAARVDLVILLVVTVVAAVPRLVLLEEIPPGLHGDEAWTGINGQRVLDEGSIGPYVTSALGYPSGALYFAAPFVKVFGHSIFAVRFSMAILGIATVSAAYLCFRVMFGRVLAVFSAVLLSFGIWHLHYSRTAFPVISWPLIVVTTVLFLFLGIKSGRWLWYGLAGLALGAGVYTYNAHPVVAVPLGLLILWVALHQRGRDLVRFSGQIALLAALAVFAAGPMILYATTPGHDYLGRFRGVSLLETEQWESASLPDRADMILDKAGDFISAAFWTGAPDGADGAGHQAMVDRASLALLVGGIGIFLWQWRRPSHLAVLLIVGLLPWGTTITTQGLFRQPLAVVPFLAVLAAAPLAFWWERAQSLPVPWRKASYAAIALIVAVVGYLNLGFYFRDYKDTTIAQFVFGLELTAASLYVRDLPGDPYVYFYSGRWSFHYETRLYLAPDSEGEDRSEEFSATRQVNLEADRSRDVVYVFLAPYLDRFDEVERLYPGGTRFESADGDGSVRFRAYLLPRLGPGEAPPGPGPTPQPRPTPTTRPGGEERDAQRGQDLAALKEALEAYQREHGGYPDNGGGIQTLCVYRDGDVGCELEDRLDPLPEDPLGEATVNGYFYSSDGRTYTIFAARESNLFPPCDQHPDHLKHLNSVLCVKGP